MTKKGDEFANRLSWGNSLISQYDIDMLRPEQWLGDGFIDFWFQICKSTCEESTQKDSNSIDFWPPSVVELMTMIGPWMAEGLLPTLTDIVFLPISNRYESNWDTGSHWSLLVISIKDGSAFHFDSCSGLNLSAARSVLNKFTSFMLKNTSQEAEMDLKNIQVKAQKNGYDCGIYVLLYSYGLSKLLVNGASSSLESLCDSLTGKITPDFVSRSRQSILSWISRWREIDPEQRKKLKSLKEVKERLGEPLRM